MSVVLFRVDERLIHGQVVLGWGRRLHPGRYVVVDDDLAESEWEQDLYLLTVEDSTEMAFLTVAQARDELAGLMDDPVGTVLLTRDIDHMLRLAEGGLLAGVDVNLGGIHDRPGRAEVRPYLFLSPEERAQLRALGETGAVVTAQDLPATLRVSLKAILAGDPERRPGGGRDDGVSGGPEDGVGSGPE